MKYKLLVVVMETEMLTIGYYYSLSWVVQFLVLSVCYLAVVLYVKTKDFLVCGNVFSHPQKESELTEVRTELLACAFGIK